MIAITLVITVAFVFGFVRIARLQRALDASNRIVHQVSSRVSELFAAAVDTAAQRQLEEFTDRLVMLEAVCRELEKMHDQHVEHSRDLAAALVHTQEVHLGLKNTSEVFSSKLLQK